MKEFDFPPPNPMPIHLAIVSSTPYSPPWNEGVRNLIHKLVNDFAERNVQVTVITPRSSREDVYQDTSARILKVSGIPEWQGQHTFLSSLAHAALLLRMSWELRKLVPRPDAVLLFASVTSLTGLRVSALKLASAKPLILFVTGLSSPRSGYQLGLKADATLVGSDFLMNWYPDAEVVYPFLPINVSPEAKFSKQEGSPFNVSFLGSFQPGRGVEFLLQAMALVKARASQPVQLSLGWNGTGTDNHENILKLIDTLGLHPITNVYGQVDVAQFYRQSDVVIIPRLSQKYMSFPVRILEAITMQTPLIVTRVCGMEKLIDGCGLSVKPGDVEDLANAILEMMNNPVQRAHYRRNCSIALARFDSNKSLDRLFEVVRSHISHD